MKTAFTNHQFDNFVDTFTRELIAMPDAEVLDGDDPDIEQRVGQKILASAKKKVGLNGVE